MRKLEKAILVILVLSFAGSAVLIALMPDTVPVHYNGAGEIDRFGSRYESLLFPLLTAGMGAFFLLFARFYQKKDGDAYAVGAKMLLYTGVFITLFFTVLGFYFMWRSLTYVPDDTLSMGEHWGVAYQVEGVAMGVLLVALGNILPKARRNRMFGLRTKWSLASDTVWQKSQRFAGISGVVCGLALIVLSLFVHGMWALAAMGAVMLLWCLLGVFASYRYWKQEQG